MRFATHHILLRDGSDGRYRRVVSADYYVGTKKRHPGRRPGIQGEVVVAGSVSYARLSTKNEWSCSGMLSVAIQWLISPKWDQSGPACIKCACWQNEAIAENQR